MSFPYEDFKKNPLDYANGGYQWPASPVNIVNNENLSGWENKSSRYILLREGYSAVIHGLFFLEDGPPNGGASFWEKPLDNTINAGNSLVDGILGIFPGHVKSANRPEELELPGFRHTSKYAIWTKTLNAETGKIEFLGGCSMGYNNSSDTGRMMSIEVQNCKSDLIVEVGYDQHQSPNCRAGWIDLNKAIFAISVKYHDFARDFEAWVLVHQNIEVLRNYEFHASHFGGPSWVGAYP